MAAKKRAKEDVYVRRIREKLAQEHGGRHPKAQIDVKRYNSVCVRIRVIDPDFKGLSRRDRHNAIWAILDTLPEETGVEISLLVLLTPEEAKTSLMNVEFEDPLPSIF